MPDVMNHIEELAFAAALNDEMSNRDRTRHSALLCELYALHVARKQPWLAANLLDHRDMLMAELRRREEEMA